MYMHEEGMIHGDLKGVRLKIPTPALDLLICFSEGQHPD